LRHESTQAAGAILDGEFAAVLLVCGRSRRVILLVEVASDGAALRRWNPQVGTTSVEDDFEGLRRGTELDLREV